MHVARRPTLRARARRLLLYARGPQGQRRKADPFSAALDGNEKDVRPRISKARSGFHGAQRIGGQAIFPLFQSLTAALPDARARRVWWENQQRRLGRVPCVAQSSPRE